MVDETQDVLIEAHDLSKKYMMGKNEIYALRDVDLKVFQGEYLSVMGPSGSGKSTLFNMIGALDRPSSGEIEVAGVQLTKLTARQLAHFRGNHIGYVFQSYNLLPAYSAVANVAMPLLFSGKPYPEAVRRAEEVLGRVGLGHRLHHRPDELSGGQQQRVAIARALANEPAIILADEPTGNLDLRTGVEIIKLLVEMNRRRGVTIMCNTHDLKIIDVSDRIVWIRDGRIDRIETADQVDVQVGRMRDSAGTAAENL